MSCYLQYAILCDNTLVARRQITHIHSMTEEVLKPIFIVNCYIMASVLNGSRITLLGVDESLVIKDSPTC